MDYVNVGSKDTRRYIVLGIDGTGSRSWMKPDGSNSHVFKFVRDFQYGSINIDRKYFHGPSDTLMGNETEPILQSALDFVNHRLSQLFPAQRFQQKQALQMFDVNSCMQSEYAERARVQAEYGMPDAKYLQIPVQTNAVMRQHQPLSMDDVKIVIVGHSRGGLAATVLARMLSPLIKVYFLGLYDSVDRQPCLNGQTIENVKYVYHAMRDPEVGSRSYFGNTSTSYAADIEYHDHTEKTFTSSHGGIGGDYIADRSKVPFGGDSSCVARPDFIEVRTEYGTTVLDNRAKLTRKLHKPIQEICGEGSRSADAFIRGGAREKGLPIQ